MYSVSRPVSEIIKNKDVDEPKKKSREDWRKAKELEEARKAGNAPAAVDEDGKDINPHLPQYISSAPWYFGAKTATLKHQRLQPDRKRDFSEIRDEYVRGLKRPRKVGYDAKRDRWAGYDPSSYQYVIEEYAKIEEARLYLKEEKLKQDYLSAESNITKEKTKDADLEDDDDEEKYADNADMPGTKVDSKQRITVRNLRIREDTAKYLRNLDCNSAYYDPKTRAMRDNPYKNTGKDDTELDYAGDNFVRYTGDTLKHSQTQSFSWQAYEKGVEVNLWAEPTKAELLHQEFKVKKGEVKDNIKNSIIDTYGGEEYLKAPPNDIFSSEHYVEYSRQGNVIKGDEKPVIISKYEEDVYINNHTAVFGSYWQDFQWGYKCCHSFIKNSYCIGHAGKEAIQEVSSIALLAEKLAKRAPSNSKAVHHLDDSAPEVEKKKKNKKHKKNKKKKKRKHHSSSSESEDSEAERKKKLKKR